jgi:hypothetical protein
MSQQPKYISGDFMSPRKHRNDDNAFSMVGSVRKRSYAATQRPKHRTFLLDRASTWESILGSTARKAKVAR